MSHNHTHGSTNYSRVFLIGITLNSLFIIFEIIFGLRSHSLALLSDAGHNFGDVLGLALAWGASRLAQKIPSAKRTYGLRSSTILASLANAILLLIATGGIAWEAFGRLLSPSPVEGVTLMWVAAIGIVINASSALLFLKDKEKDLNLKGAFMHLMGDAVIACGVVLTGFLILKTNWLWLDPVVSIIIAVAIVMSTWSLLKDSLNLVLHAVPEAIDIEKIKTYFTNLPNVKNLHDLHIWSISTTEIALTAHVILKEKTSDDFIDTICHDLHDEFGIEHSTIQIEHGDGQHQCHLEPEEKV